MKQNTAILSAIAYCLLAIPLTVPAPTTNNFIAFPTTWTNSFWWTATSPPPWITLAQLLDAENENWRRATTNAGSGTVIFSDTLWTLSGNLLFPNGSVGTNSYWVATATLIHPR